MLEVFLLVSENSRSEPVAVLFVRLVLYPFKNIVELAENFPHEEFLRERKRLNSSISNIEELTLQVLSQVEITKVFVSLDKLSKFVLVGAHAGSCQVSRESYSYLTRCDEVHFGHFFFLFVNQIFIVFCVEFARL